MPVRVCASVRDGYHGPRTTIGAFTLGFEKILFLILRMTSTISAVIILATITIIHAQRPFYAGSRPIGYPSIEGQELSNRFGEDEPVPIETKGDRNFINRIESVPIDNRPFWYINWLQYQDLRRRPQTWPLKPNNFIDK